MMTELTLRLASAGDITRLSDLWYEHAAMLVQQDARWSLAGDARSVWADAASRWLANERMRMLVACRDEQVVAFVVAAMRDAPAGFSPATIGVIQHLVVDAHQYAGGAAHLLVKGASAWFREVGIKHWVVEVPRRAVIEQAFWRALGAAAWMETLWIRS
jgi:hypothetical protein